LPRLRKSLRIYSLCCPSTDFTGSVGCYKFDKYSKHTSLPSATTGTVSVFDNSDYDTYKNYIIDTANSGSVEIDDMNRINLIWFANKNTGQSFIHGCFDQNTDGIKLVLHDDNQKIHPYPTSSFGFSNTSCDNCSKSIMV
jgi:hypothetical protein